MRMRVCVCSGERRLGDLEVALTLEDLGPIVQPTVQLDAEQKLVSKLALLHTIVRMKSLVRVSALLTV